MQNEMEPVSGGKKVIKTSTGLIVIFAAVVLFFGGALSYWYYNDPNSYDTSKDSTIVATTVPNSNTNASNTNVNGSANVNANTNSSSATADWKTYTNDTYNFSFKYPKAWTTTDTTLTNALLSVNLNNGTAAEGTDNPGLANVYVYDTLSKLDTSKLSPTTLKDYLDKYAALTDPMYLAITTQKIADLSGYSAKMGPNQFGGGSSYFVTLSSGKILQFRTFETGTTADQITNILSTFQFTK